VFNVLLEKSLSVATLATLLAVPLAGQAVDVAVLGVTAQYAVSVVLVVHLSQWYVTVIFKRI